MSNIDSSFTSNNNYENNHVMISQGGNKKAMKKILSVALSTAMAFSMFASVAFGQSGLTDVNEQYNYLKDKGIFTGYTDGQAHLDRNMTRAEFATVIARTLGLEQVTGVVSFNDKNYSTKHWAAPYVEAVAKEGIMEGQNTTKKIFGLTSNVTVQEMATVLVRALKLEIPADSEINNTASAWAKGYVQAAINAGLVDANADFQSNATRALLVGAAYAMDQQVSVGVKSYNVTEAGKVVEFTMSDDQVVKVTLDQALEANKETEVKFTYNGKEYTHKVTYVVTAAAVESVSAINAKQLVIKFNQEMDESTLFDSSSKVIKNISFSATTSSSDAVTTTSATGELSEDGKELTVTLASGETFEGTYSVVVSKAVQSANGEAISDYATTFTITDKVAPEVVSVSAVTNSTSAKSVKIKFSEPVAAGVVKINGTVYQPTGMGTTELVVSGLSLDATKTHTLDVLNATDAKGNQNALKTIQFSVTKDTVAPTVQYSVIGDSQIKLTFSKDMDPSTVTKANVVVLKAQNLGSVSYTVTQPDTTNDKEFLITVGENLFTESTTSTLKVQVNENVKDALGNKATVTSYDVALNKDVTAPTLVSTEVTKSATGNADKLKLTFSEKLKAAPANLDNVAVKNAETGETVTASTILDSTVTLSKDGKTLELTVKSDALGNKYNITLKKGFVEDTAYTANASAAVSKTIEFPAAASSFKLDQSSNLDVATANKIKITYPQTVLGDFSTYAANNPANYSVAGKSLPADTDITIDSTRKIVEITLPAEFIETTDAKAVLTVNNVKSVSGDLLTPFVGYANVKDNVSPVLKSGKTNSDGSVTLTFSEDIETASVSSDYVVTLNGYKLLTDNTPATTLANITSGADKGGQLLTIAVKLDNGTGSAGDGDETIYVDVDGDGSFNVDKDLVITKGTFSAVTDYSASSTIKADDIYSLKVATANSSAALTGADKAGNTITKNTTITVKE